MECVQGSMTDLSMFPDAAFDVVFNPVSVVYVDDVHGVWRECYRVLKPDGRLMMGSINPLNFLFEDNEGVDDVGLLVRYALPFVEENALDEHALQAALDRNMVFCRSHTLEHLIGGQTRAGFVIADFYESRREDERAPSINRYCPTYFATLALKLP